MPRSRHEVRARSRTRYVQRAPKRVMELRVANGKSVLTMGRVRVVANGIPTEGSQTLTVFRTQDAVVTRTLRGKVQFRDGIDRRNRRRQFLLREISRILGMEIPLTSHCTENRGNGLYVFTIKTPEQGEAINALWDHPGAREISELTVWES